MSQSMTTMGRQFALKTILGQLVILALLTLILALSTNGKAAVTCFIGGLAAVIPNAIFAVIAFLHAGARANQQVVKSFFLGEGVKLLLTAVIISGLFLITNLNPMWLITGFVIAVLAQWIAPILFLKST